MDGGEAAERSEPEGVQLVIEARLVLLDPGLGGLVAAPFMYASTLALGAAARAWFESNGGLDREAAQWAGAIGGIWLDALKSTAAARMKA